MSESQTESYRVDEPNLGRRWTSSQWLIENGCYQAILDWEDQLIEVCTNDFCHDRDCMLCSSPYMPAQVREFGYEDTTYRMQSALFVCEGVL